MGIHTGDFSDHGSDEQIADFVAWLSEIADRFAYILVIPGNHDWYVTVDRVGHGTLSAEDVVSPGFMQRKFRSCGLPENCRVLDHEEVNIKGLRIWGSSWCPWHPCGNPDGVAN